MMNLNRRSVLLAGCAAMVGVPSLVTAQEGFSPYRNDLQSGLGTGFANPVAQTSQQLPKPIVIETPSTTQVRGGYIEQRNQVVRPEVAQDWREGLLRGDRTVKVRRNGGAIETVTYLNRDGTINAAGYQRMCWLLRDVRGGNVAIQMDLGVIDLVCGLQRWAAHNGVVAIVNLTSGYRSDRTNARTEGAAKNSLHKQGRAIDFVMEGIRSRQQGAMVSAYNSRGGTGIYMAQGFVHADTGRPRVWRG